MLFLRPLISKASLRDKAPTKGAWWRNPNLSLVHLRPEKYLYAKALRGAAVIISPKGFSDPAKRAPHGALRDVGKLMLDLDAPLLCKLLEAKDLAQPPGAEMERLIDAFLLEVGR